MIYRKLILSSMSRISFSKAFFLGVLFMLVLINDVWK